MNNPNYFEQNRTMAALWNFPGWFLPCSQFLYVPTGESNRFAACSWVRPAAFRHFLSRLGNLIAGHKAVFEVFDVIDRALKKRRVAGKFLECHFLNKWASIGLCNIRLDLAKFDLGFMRFLQGGKCLNFFGIFFCRKHDKSVINNTFKTYNNSVVSACLTAIFCLKTVLKFPVVPVLQSMKIFQMQFPNRKPPARDVAFSLTPCDVAPVCFCKFSNFIRGFAGFVSGNEIMAQNHPAVFKEGIVHNSNIRESRI